MLARSDRARTFLRTPGFVRDYVLPALLLVGILLAWDFTKPRLPTHFPEPVIEAEPLPNGGVPPWNAHEDIAQRNRDSLRKSTQRSLDQAWSTFCDAKGRQNLIGAVSGYFSQRGLQEKSYPERWGKDGAEYIAQQWSTADDQRIERLVRELYWRGYLVPAELKPAIAARIAPLLQDTRVIDAPCAR